MVELNTIEFDLEERLRADPEFRREWFRAELEQGVPEQIRAMREARGMTQADLAKAAGMSQPAIARLERSRPAAWNTQTLLHVAEALNCHLTIKFEQNES